MSKVKIENISPTRKRLVVPVSAEEVLKADVKVITAIKNQAQVPGFRAGKAPEAMVRSKYAKVIADELQREVVTESYEKALKDAELDLASVVDIEGDPVAVGRNSVVSVTVDVYPEIKLPKYKEISVKLASVKVDEAEVEKTIDLVRGQKAQFAPAERPAQSGDYVRLSYTGTLEGKPVSEIVPDKPIYGTQANTWEEAGSHDYGIKAISEGVIGMKKDDKKTVAMDFAKDFDVAALAGKKVSYELHVLEVREKKMPELNEEFYKSIGVKDIEELKTNIRKSLEERAKEEQETAKRNQVSEALMAKIDFPLPESIVNAENQAIIQDLIDENQRRGVSEEVLQKNQKQLIESAKEAATKRVKLRLILREIAKAEKIETSEEDFQRWIMTESMQRQSPPEKIVKELTDDRQRMNNLAQALKLSKTMKWLVDGAKVEEAK